MPTTTPPESVIRQAFADANDASGELSRAKAALEQAKAALSAQKAAFDFAHTQYQAQKAAVQENRDWLESIGRSKREDWPQMLDL